MSKAKKAGQTVDKTNTITGDWSLLIILLAGVIPRIYDLNRGLWPDEIHNWENFSSRSLSWITTHFLPAFNHIFHSVLVRISTQIFSSQSEVIIRLPAVTCGILQIWATYKLAEILYKNKQVATMAAFIIAFSPVHIYFSQAARGYSLLMLFSTLALYILFLTEEASKHWLWFVICATLAAYAIIVGLFFVVAVFVWYLAFVYPEKRKVSAFSSGNIGLLAFGASFVVISLLYLPVSSQLFSFKGQGTLADYAFWPLVDGPIKELYYYCTKGLSHFITVLCLVGLAGTFKADKKIAWLFLLILIIPFALTYLRKATAFGRTFLFVMPIFYILAAYGAYSICEFVGAKFNFKPLYGTIGFLAIFGLFYGYHLLFEYYPEKDGNYKQTAQYITGALETSNYNDLVITEWNHDWANSFYMGEQLGQALKTIYLSDKINNLYLVNDRASAVYVNTPFYGLDKIRFWAIFGSNPRLDWAFPKEKFTPVEKFTSSAIYRMNVKRIDEVFSPMDKSGLGAKSAWQKLNPGDFSLRADNVNFFKGNRSLLFTCAGQQSPNILISKNRARLSIGKDSIILLLYAQPADENNLATLYFTDEKGQVAPLQMVYINRMNTKNHIFKKGPAYWKVTAQFYITTKQMRDPGLCLIAAGQARYDDFAAFALQ